jgi:hypothetical protein
MHPRRKGDAANSNSHVVVSMSQVDETYTIARAEKCSAKSKEVDPSHPCQPVECHMRLRLALFCSVVGLRSSSIVYALRLCCSSTYSVVASRLGLELRRLYFQWRTGRQALCCLRGWDMVWT